MFTRQFLKDPVGMGALEGGELELFTFLCQQVEHIRGSLSELAMKDFKEPREVTTRAWRR